MKSPASLSDAELERLIRRAIAQPDAPAAQVRRAIEAFAAGQVPSVAPTVSAVVHRIAALLSFDSWVPAPGLAGMRGVPSDTRHLLFSAQGRDIDLRITPTAGHYALTGQILGPDETGAIELAPDAGDTDSTPPARTARLDEFGEFRLDGVSPGTYRLTLRMAGDEIALPSIAVGERHR